MRRAGRLITASTKARIQPRTAKIPHPSPAFAATHKK